MSTILTANIHKVIAASLVKSKKDFKLLNSILFHDILKMLGCNSYIKMRKKLGYQDGNNVKQVWRFLWKRLL